MSCDWNVFCVDCKDQHYFCDANHQPTLMATLIRHADAIANLVPLFEEADRSSTELTIHTRYGPVRPTWFARHRGHKLVPIDEYGRFEGECGNSVTCSACERSHMCRRPFGHDGPCSARRGP